MTDARRCPLSDQPGPSSAWVDRVMAADIALVSGEMWETGPSWSIPRRRLPDCWWFLPITGALEGVVGKRPLSFRPGQALVVPPQRDHQVRYASDCRTASMLSIHAICHEADGRALVDDLPAVIAVDPAWLTMWRRHLRLWQREPERMGAVCLQLLRLFLIDLGREVTGAAAGPAVMGDARVQRSLGLMRRHLDWNVAQVADAVGVSPGRLRVLFRTALGRSPVAVLRDLRLDAAQRLLRLEPGCPLAAVAQRCGYASTQYFHQDFRSRLGRGPGAWRAAQIPV